jgi:signal peptidase I
MPRPDDGPAGTTTWSRLVVVVLARAYRGVFLTLTLVAVAPMVLGWGAYVVKSGSMRPSISVGDVVIARPTSVDDRVRVGRVYVFDDPSRPGRVLVHRIVERRDEGGFTTAGDANGFTDSTPLQPTGIRAQAILLAPWVGLPVQWLQSRDFVRLGAWLALTVAAFVLASGRLERRRDRPPPGAPGAPGPGRFRRTTARRALAPVAAATVLMVAGTAATTPAGAGFTSRTASASNTWTAGAWNQKYAAAVITDRPYGFWLLDEPAGSAYAQDRSGNNQTGQYYAPLVLGRPGGLPNNPGTAVGVGGGRVVLGTNLVSAPGAYSIELWFRTTSSSGGFMAGFENDRDDDWRSGTADRLVYLAPSGRLAFGLWGNQTTAVTTPRAYNDGAWHHLVVTSTAARSSIVYVDGLPVASGTTSTVEAYPGYWRIGQGSTGNKNGFSSSFPGDLDTVSIFHSVLSATRVAAHWNAR